MAREHKRKFATIEHPAIPGVSVQAYIVTSGDDKGMFHADTTPNSTRARTFDELAKVVQARIKADYELDWKPVMTIQLKPGNDQFSKRWDHGIMVSYSRFYVAKRPDNTWIKVDWDIIHKYKYDKLTNSRRVFHDYDELPKRVYKDSSDRTRFCLVMDYDQTIWESIEWLEGEIDNLMSVILSTLSTAKGREKLVLAATKKEMNLLTENLE